VGKLASSKGFPPALFAIWAAMEDDSEFC